MATEKKTPDWLRIEAEFRAGIKPLRQIGEENGITHGAINKRAKRDGWVRDLGAKIRAKADAEVSKRAVSNEVSKRKAATEKQVIDSNVHLQVKIRMEHRSDITRVKSLLHMMLAEAESHHPTNPRSNSMNALTIPGGAAVTMTSLELVDFINSQRAEGESELRHDHFMAKVPKVLGDAAPKFSGTAFYINGTGAKVDRTIYTFPKREACLMAMSYSYDLQAKVFDRMTALEARPIDPMQVLSDPAAMRGLLLTYTEKVLTLEHKVEELAPKAQALDRIADADGTMNPTIAAKTLQIQPKRLFDWMRKQHWIQDVSLCKRAMAPPKSQVRPWYGMARSSRLPIRSSRRATLGKTLMAVSGLAGGPIRPRRRSSRSGLGIGRSWNLAYPVDCQSCCRVRPLTAVQFLVGGC